MRGKNSLSSARLGANALTQAYELLQSNPEEGEKLLLEALTHVVDAANFARLERLKRGRHCEDNALCTGKPDTCKCGCGNCQEATR